MIIAEGTPSVLIKKTAKGYFLDISENVMVETEQGITAGNDILNPEEVLLQFYFIGDKVDFKLPPCMTVTIEDASGDFLVVESDKDLMITNIYRVGDETKTPVKEVEIDIFNGLLMLVTGIAAQDPTKPKQTTH